MTESRAQSGVAAPSQETPMRFSGMRRSTKAGEGRLPEFIIIGASKSGTTTLWQYLRRHPDVYLAEPKEPEFFSKDDRFALGLDSYKALFAPALEGQRCGEASTTYTRWPHFADVPARMAEVVPDAKLIYIMRHPVDRTYSNYRHRMRLDVPRWSFEEALDADPMFVDTSMYMLQIQKYLEYFPRESLLCLLLEDLVREPNTVLAQVQHHIGVEMKDLVTEGAIASNTSGDAGDDFARQRLRKLKRLAPGYHQAKHMIPDAIKDRALRMLTNSPFGTRLKRGYQPSQLTSETRARLLRHFEGSNRELAAFLDRDLEMWSK